MQASFLFLHLFPRSLAALLLALGVRLRVLPLLRLIVSGVALDEREGPLLAVRVRCERDAANLGLEGDAAEVLLFVMLTDGKLVVSDVVALQRAIIGREGLLELVELLLEGLLQVAHYLAALALEA